MTELPFNCPQAQSTSIARVPHKSRWVAALWGGRGAPPGCGAPVSSAAAPSLGSPGTLLLPEQCSPKWAPASRAPAPWMGLQALRGLPCLPLSSKEKIIFLAKKMVYAIRDPIDAAALRCARARDGYEARWVCRRKDSRHPGETKI